MTADGDSPASRDVIDVAIPPIPDPVPDELMDQETGDLLTEEFAAFARERAGTCGGIGVGLEIVDTLLDDLRSFDERGTRPGELRHHAEMLAELEQVLVETADMEIDDYESTLYDPQGGDASSTRDRNDASESKYPQSAFKIGYVDRISSSDNLIAIPGDGSHDHLHVSAGILGKKCVLYDPNKVFPPTSVISKKPIALPFPEIEEARACLVEHSSIPIQKGEVIQLPTNPEKDEFVSLPERSVDGIRITGGRGPNHEYTLVQVRGVHDGIATGKIVTKNDIRVGSRPGWVKEIVKARRKRKKRRSSKQTSWRKKNPDNLNKLLKGMR